MVEFLGDVVGELQMLALVVAHGDEGGVVGVDVGGHEVEPADSGDAVEQPGQAGVGGDGGLVEQDVLVRLDAHGDEQGGHDAGIFA